MPAARAVGRARLDVERALALWTDVGRWPTFVEGFARVLDADERWPAPGAKLVWESGRGGRGKVTERVVEAGYGCFATQVYEQALIGTQTVTFRPHPDGGSELELALEYELARYGPLRAAADVLFIRRSLRDALVRTLRRFAVEAEDELGLR